MPLDFEDPLENFRQAFELLLAPKALAAIDLQKTELQYTLSEQVLGMETLSSGEKEVFAVVFDLLLRNPEDYVIFIDEPDLHLHPELSFRLLRTLETVGLRNQYVLCTHSSDIISASLDHSVVLLRPTGIDENQAIVCGRGDEGLAPLQELGQSLGIISLGRQVVLVEGAEKSVDCETYGAIIREHFPGVALAPVGPRRTLTSFANLIKNVLDKTIWGVSFFMLADRDSSLADEELKKLEEESDGRLRFLERYHVENYFLDEATISDALADLHPESHWARDPRQVRERLRSLARANIPVAVNLWLSSHLRSAVGELDLSLKEVERLSREQFLVRLPERLSQEHERVRGILDEEQVRGAAKARWELLERSLDDDSRWKYLFPGKILVGKLCGDLQIKKGQFRHAYIQAARRKDFAPFEEILRLFRAWLGQ